MLHTKNNENLRYNCLKEKKDYRDKANQTVHSFMNCAEEQVKVDKAV